MSVDYVLFGGLALVTILSALGMLFSRNAVYSALYLIFNFSTIAVLYLMLSAPFIALAQITVYAGAIMVLFLFVIMLLGAEQRGQAVRTWWMQPLALGLAGILIFEAIYLIFTHRTSFPPLRQAVGDLGNPLQIGEQLFSNYLLAFEAVALLLLVAVIGAIFLSRGRKLR
ncbi:MAG: NADH-quinone oxidoreductase subunit J [Anaerolineales bacterium]|nr:NADH-quinone oxidoreductase subunit J [Anaerolineales bacterium]MDW8162401.1 NADH-quinone oxidoreductase subunit J [Anaerolineales bacterium]